MDHGSGLRPWDWQDQAREFIHHETEAVADELDTLRRCFEGKTALIEIAEFPGPIRALSLAQMAEEFGAHPIVINLHPYTVKERMPSIKFLLQQGINPEVILTNGLFSLGSFNVSSETQAEVELIARQYENCHLRGHSPAAAGNSSGEHDHHHRLSAVWLSGHPQHGQADAIQHGTCPSLPFQTVQKGAIWGVR